MLKVENLTRGKRQPLADRIPNLINVTTMTVPSLPLRLSYGRFGLRFGRQNIIGVAVSH
jgi:hypothetical protein